MYRYQVYGQQLHSALPFPELRSVPAGTSGWAFRMGPERDPASIPDAPILGRQTIYPGCHATLAAMASGWRIVVDDTGLFELRDEGREITWFPFPGASIDFGRAHLLGRVLSTALHFNGALVLHGSAVAYPAGSVIFLAPKHTGKSTLAMALTMAGARLISDDTITIDQPDHEPALVRPGVHSLRLLSDSLERSTHTPREQHEDGKFLVTDLLPEQLEEGSTRLAAVYLLAAAESIHGGLAVARRPVPQPMAAAALVGQGKISLMLGPDQAPTLLRRSAQLVSRVPVYQLAVLRDFQRLSEVAGQLAEWHAV